MATERYGDNFDFTVEADISVGLISEGVRKLRCKDAKVEDNRAKDGKNLVLTLVSIERAEKGRQVTTWISLKDSARWKLTEALHAFGVEIKEDSRGRPTARLKREMFVGQKVRARISHQDWNGTDRAQVDQLLPFTPAAKDPAEPSKTAQQVQNHVEKQEAVNGNVDDDDDDDDTPPARTEKSGKKGGRQAPPPPADDDDDEDDDDDDVEQSLPF